MSAITITFGARGEAAAVREAQLVAEGLAKQSGRAPGGSDVQTVEGAVLGVRASIPIAQYGRGTDIRESQRRASHRETAQGTVSLVLSGFVDNGPEVLAAAGLDAEASVADALLELYLEHGASFIEQVGGAFAIALWDGRNQRGHLLRDRLGIEPLYFAVVGREGLLRASSEPKGLLVDQRIPRRFDLQAIPDLLNSSSRTPGTTVYRDLWEVRPGEILTFQAGRISQQVYWRLPKTLRSPTEHEAAEAVDELLAASVRRRALHSSGASGVGYLLSGGLDSSLIASIAAEDSPTPIDTYSFSYEDAETDFKPDALHVSLDAPFVDIMSEHIGSNHSALTVRNERFAESLRDTVHARDLPGVGDLDVALLRILASVSTQKSIVFSGEAADDIFGGYPWFAHEFQHPGKTFPWLRGSTASDLLRPDIRSALDLEATLRARSAAAVSDAQIGQERDDVEAHMRGVFWSELTRFLPFLLDRVDRMAAAAGVRVMLPFTDHRLVEYTWDLPFHVKSVGDIEKGILRLAGRHRLPQSVAVRRKSGFAVGKSPAYRAAIDDAVRDLLTRESVVWELADRDRVRKLVASETWNDGKFSGPPILPRLVLLDIWTTDYSVSFV